MKYFPRMMHTDIGGVEYDDEAKLHLGSDFENTEKKLRKMWTSMRF